MGRVGSRWTRTEGFLKVMNRSSQRIIIESVSRWKREQQDDSHQEEEDSASATSENGKREVAKGPPPLPEGQCVQISADANLRGPPGHVNENEGEEAKDYL